MLLLDVYHIDECGHFRAKVNGIQIERDGIEFGYIEEDYDDAPDYGCGTRDFVSYKNSVPSEELLTKYSITPEQYKAICLELEDLYWSSCADCE